MLGIVERIEHQCVAAENRIHGGKMKKLKRDVFVK